MRVIKFRALHDDVWSFQKLEEIITITLTAFRIGKHKSQFIGMYDKKGAEIYEGDIIQYAYWGEDGELCFSNMQIFWNKDTAQFCYDDSYLSNKTSFQELNKEFCLDVVVVGNIHQNKNLLIPTDL